MMTDLNLALFHIINELAGKNYILDNAAIFTAKYLIYIFVVYLIYLWFVRSEHRQEVLFAGYAALLGIGINFIITLFYFHPRPFMIPTGTLLIAHAPETSFPSDHTTLMFAISLMLLTFRELRSKGAILFVLVFIGGLSRVYAGLHFPLDIVGSLFVALFSTGLLLLLKRYLVPINCILIIYFGNIEDKLRKRIRYKWAFITTLVILLFFFGVPYNVYGQTGLTPIFIAIGGLLLSIPIGYFWYVFKQPVLKIHEEIEQRGITVVEIIELSNFAKNYIYQANRIIVENVGRSAAKNCKAWILTEKSKERVCWTVPKERPNATINVNDSERLDFCAYYRSGKELYTGTEKRIPKIFCSDENELPTNIDIANLKSLDGLSNCRVLITSDNTEPIEAKVKFEDDKIRVEP